MAVDVVALIVPLAFLCWALIYITGAVFEWWFWDRHS